MTAMLPAAMLLLLVFAAGYALRAALSRARRSKARRWTGPAKTASEGGMEAPFAPLPVGTVSATADAKLAAIEGQLERMSAMLAKELTRHEQTALEMSLKAERAEEIAEAAQAEATALAVRLASAERLQRELAGSLEDARAALAKRHAALERAMTRPEPMTRRPLMAVPAKGGMRTLRGLTPKRPPLPQVRRGGRSLIPLRNF